MGMEAPPNIMKAGERPARIRTGAKTATKGQERAMLDKLEEVASHPEYLVPEWLGSGRSPFAKLDRKLRKVQSRRQKVGWLRWLARGKKLWNGYAASLVVLRGEKIPSFASIKFQGHDVKFVYRSGTGRQALIGVQHYDDPEVRLLGYTESARKHRVYLVSGKDRFVAVPRGGKAPPEFLTEFLGDEGIATHEEEGVLRCDHATGGRWRYRYDLPDLGWKAALCMDCLQKVKGTFHEFLERHMLGPDKHLDVKRQVRGNAYTIRPESATPVYEGLIDQAFERAKKHAADNYVQYSDIELAQWTRDELLKILKERPEGFLLVGDDLWLASYEEAAKTYTDSDLERRALIHAFKLKPPALRVSGKSLHKILEPYWAEHGG
ncbi:MAG: hypothetical protein HYT80_00570, partial [Euryarchaeota archaeon]|nr:hypothetical protein [Euryarchaeota archaeon]